MSEPGGGFTLACADAITTLLHDRTRRALLHGVTHNRPARSGFAFAVNSRCSGLPVLVNEPLDVAHYGIEPGEILEVRFGLYAGVTQREYREADLELIKQCVTAATLDIKKRQGVHSQLVVPLIGGGLGGLTPEEAYEAIRSAPRHCSVLLCVLDENLYKQLAHL